MPTLHIRTLLCPCDSARASSATTVGATDSLSELSQSGTGTSSPPFVGAGGGDGGSDNPGAGDDAGDGAESDVGPARASGGPRTSSSSSSFRSPCDAAGVAPSTGGDASAGGTPYDGNGCAATPPSSSLPSEAAYSRSFHWSFVRVELGSPLLLVVSGLACLLEPMSAAAARRAAAAHTENGMVEPLHAMGPVDAVSRVALLEMYGPIVVTV